MRASILFILLSLVGVAESLIHAWQENAFTTSWGSVSYSPLASFFGVPYWIFGVAWFPLVFVVGLWTTRLGRMNLGRGLLVLLTLGNVFTGYLWFVDLVVIRTFTAAYVGLYVTNYALTGLVIAGNWSRKEMREFATGTVVGMLVGVFFGAIGVASFGILGGILGAIGGYTSTK